jgi:uncharacterized protein
VPSISMSDSKYVVSNASPLIAFERIGQLPLLQGLFGEIQIPPGVAHEVFGGDSAPPWVRVVMPSSAISRGTNIGRGELEAIALAEELDARWVILDDLPARRLAVRLGLRVIGTVGLLVVAKRASILDAVRPMLDALDAAEFRLASDVRDAILRTAGELERS